MSIVGLALVAMVGSGCGSEGGKPAVAIEGTIVFASGAKTMDSDIYLLDANGSRRVAGDGFINQAYPAWSPDGTQVAYVTETWQLAVVNRDGSGGALLTPKSNDPSLWANRPAWLPDGNISIAVGGKLAVLRPDGTGVAVLTPSNPRKGKPGFGGAYAWSPDGAQVVFDCSLFPSEPEVCMFDAKSGESRALVEPPRPFYAFAWSPNGTTIVAGDWSSGQEGVEDDQHDLYVFDADGQGLHALAQPGKESNPAWSPDGTMIVYHSFTQDSGEVKSGIWIMNADGSGAQQLLSGIPANQPDWTEH